MLVVAEGYTHWYSVTIPAQTSYELQVDRVEGPALNVEVIDGDCDGACSDSRDAYFHARRDPTVPLVNDGTEPRHARIAITPDGQSGFELGHYTVEIVSSAQ